MKSVNLPPFRLMALMTIGWLIGTGGAAHAQSGAPNLFTNGNFEKGTEGWEITIHMKHGKMSADDTERYEGKPTLKIENAGGVDDTLVMQKVTVKPHTRYKLTGMIKTKSVEPANRKGKSGASLSIQGGYDGTKALQHDMPWTRAMLEIDSGPRAEISLGPRLGHYSAAVGGTAWFADLSLVELGPGKK
jgi:hypothetical protein